MGSANNRPNNSDNAIETPQRSLAVVTLTGHLLVHDYGMTKIYKDPQIKQSLISYPADYLNSMPECILIFRGITGWWGLSKPKPVPKGARLFLAALKSHFM